MTHYIDGMVLWPEEICNFTKLTVITSENQNLPLLFSAWTVTRKPHLNVTLHLFLCLHWHDFILPGEEGKIFDCSLQPLLPRPISSSVESINGQLIL